MGPALQHTEPVESPASQVTKRGALLQAAVRVARSKIGDAEKVAG